MLPDKALLYIGAIEDEDYKHEKIDFWDSVSKGVVIRERAHEREHEREDERGRDRLLGLGNCRPITTDGT